MKKGAFKKSERPMGECACVAGICQSAKHTYEKRLVSFETSLSPVYLGGDKRDRTADLLNAIQALSQLSYTPEFFITSERNCRKGSIRYAVLESKL